jgi:chorismate synthase
MPDHVVAPERARDTRERAETELAVAALHPERFGLRRHREGWRKSFPGLGEVVFAPLGWQHAQCPSFDVVAGEREPLDALLLVVRLQARVWGMPPEELVPVNMLAVLPDTGGSVLVAYREDDGFNADGWLGFAIAAGSSSGALVSHMLGVREEQRGTRDLGWHLKLLQGYEALRTGHRAAVWTFDPMRGANARLNLEKLGARVRELTLDKYGVLRSDLYGDVPSDRFTVYWDLTEPSTHRRIEAVRTDRYPGPDPDLVRSLPEITLDNAVELAATAPRGARYRIPADIDELMTVDAQRANAWRAEMRAALSPFMTVKSARVPENTGDAPIAVGVDVRFGAYDVVAFATEGRDAGSRENWYLLRRRGGEGQGGASWG